MTTHISYSLKATRFAEGNRRPWIAEIRGTDERFGYQRRFIRPSIEYGKKDRPETLWYALRDGRLHEVQRHVKGAKLERVFVEVRDGKPVEITKDELDAELARRESAKRRPLGKDVHSAARERMAWVFDSFPKVCVSFSGGKDSTVLLHLAAEEARRRRRRFGLLLIDWEAQFRLTIDHVAACFKGYADCTEPYWVALPLTTVNACSQIEPEWVCWDERKRDLWVRHLPEGDGVVSDPDRFPFYRHRMTFEEFAPEFGRWFAGDALTCHLVGLRAGESLNRMRSILSSRKTRFRGKCWTTWLGGPAWNAYPLYDWKAEDVWTYTAREAKPYNRAYDRMHQAGLTVSQMRICEPFGDEQRRGLWLWHVLEPDSWAKLVARVSGAGMGALYCIEKGNAMGNGAVSLPDGMTWKAFAEFLLATMPKPTADHYRAKIAVWQRWYEVNRDMPASAFADALDGDLTGLDQPSWRRVCKVLLKNDYWCKGLGFSPTSNSNYDRYREAVRKRIHKWQGGSDEG